MSRLGIIADDFTGATDIAGFLVTGGVATSVYSGVPEAPDDQSLTDAVVICLKIRSVPPQEAVKQALAALSWLQDNGCGRFFYKYCSTFDSTPQGNIGPVTEALAQALGQDLTVLCPALPQVGRTVYKGHLFVLGEPLAESPMRYHPVNPMTDSSLVRLIEAQSHGRAAVVPWETVDNGAEAVRSALDRLQQAGTAFAVLDCLRAADLTVLAEATANMQLVTGGSGLGDGIARAGLLPRRAATELSALGRPGPGAGVILSGSCSAQTNRQVAAYRDKAPFCQVDPARCLAEGPAYAAELADWVLAQPADSLFPLVAATVAVADNAPSGDTGLSIAIEDMFADLARRLHQRGTSTFVVAGGETSSAVTKALGMKSFLVGPQISPGVPWLRSSDGGTFLALKSGNFGDDAFFQTAQKDLCSCDQAGAALTSQDA